MSNETLLGAQGMTACANHWKRHGHLMEKIIADELLHFALTKEYSPNEMKSFRDGLARMAEVYEACCTELENKNKNKDSDG